MAVTFSVLKKNSSGKLYGLVSVGYRFLCRASRSVLSAYFRPFLFTHPWHLTLGSCGPTRKDCTNSVFLCLFEGIAQFTNFRIFLSYAVAPSIPLSVVFITSGLGLTTVWSCRLPSNVDFLTVGRFPDPLPLSGSVVLADYVVVWGFTDSHSRQPAGWSDDIRPVQCLQPVIWTCSACVCACACHIFIPAAWTVF